MNIKDGGPTFPTVKWEQDEYGNFYPSESEGMTLRDHFAGLALGGYIAYMGCEADVTGHMGGQNKEVIARNAYSYADAMLRAREEV